ncbi:MAG: hypothetical protein ACI3W7_10175 [Oscillospiraceae bacterium]
MGKFSLVVNGITRKEYFAACRENGRRIYRILAGAMVVICGAIMLATGDFSLRAFLGPVAVFLVVIVGYELVTRLGYKNQLEVLDPPMVYDFHGGRWKVTLGDQVVEIEWKATPRLHKTKTCIFLYSDEVSCNLVPRRLLTDEQVLSLETWYKNTRPLAKAYRKQQEKERRQKYKNSHPSQRLGRTGPVWGPWKKR